MRRGVKLLVFVGMIICSDVMGQLSNIQGLDNVVIRTRKYEDISGSAYLYPDWNSGTLIDKNGKSYFNLQLKYDAYMDRVELNQDGQVLEINATAYPKFTLDFAERGTNNIVKHSFSSGYNIPGFSRTNYFDLVREGELTLLRKFKTSFVEQNVSGYGTTDQKKSFQTKILYFILFEDGSAKEVKLNKKSILEIFPEESNKLETFLKNEKNKLKSEMDLIKAIDFVESN
jgi:hypothetical protein